MTSDDTRKLTDWERIKEMLPGIATELVKMLREAGSVGLTNGSVSVQPTVSITFRDRDGGPGFAVSMALLFQDASDE